MLKVRLFMLHSTQNGLLYISHKFISGHLVRTVTCVHYAITIWKRLSPLIVGL